MALFRSAAQTGLASQARDVFSGSLQLPIWGQMVFSLVREPDLKIDCDKNLQRFASSGLLEHVVGGCMTI